MNCKYFRIRTKKGIKYFYCSLLKKETDSGKCKICTLKKYRKKKTIKKHSNKLISLESSRTLLNHKKNAVCGLCGKKGVLHCHEVFFGRNRLKSIKNGMLELLCVECHNLVHNDRATDLLLKRKHQKIFEKTHNRDKFIKIFGRNYLD